jgi:hypothetical protein
MITSRLRWYEALSKTSLQRTSPKLFTSEEPAEFARDDNNRFGLAVQRSAGIQDWAAFRFTPCRDADTANSYLSNSSDRP